MGDIAVIVNGIIKIFWLLSEIIRIYYRTSLFFLNMEAVATPGV